MGATRGEGEDYLQYLTRRANEQLRKECASLTSATREAVLNDALCMPARRLNRSLQRPFFSLACLQGVLVKFVKTIEGARKPQLPFRRTLTPGMRSSVTLKRNGMRGHVWRWQRVYARSSVEHSGIASFLALNLEALWLARYFLWDVIILSSKSDVTVPSNL
jgi:hypothetical protein